MKKKKSKGKRNRQKRTPADIYTLEVCVLTGPMTEEFVEKNRVVSRTIEIRGSQTLEELHHVIFDAFDRKDEHMYEFQIGGKRPMDPKARRYDLPVAMHDPFPDGKPAGDVTRATIASLGLKVDEPFGYWFDFGDDWWHQINVLAIGNHAPGGNCPRVTRRVGESPPQYIDWDEEEE